jgi:hypothetical protein
MEPALVTASELLGVQRELVRREPIFHRREFAATRAQFWRTEGGKCFSIRGPWSKVSRHRSARDRYTACPINGTGS